MSNDLLREVESARSVVGSLENIEDLLRVVMREAGGAIENLKGSARKFENSWQRIVMEVARGRTSEAQGTRSQMLKAFEGHFDLLKRTHHLVGRLRKLPGTEALPDPDILLPEIVGMERLKANVFDRWQTTEDLEDLAARDYPLTTADLDRIGPHRRPPASYYAEESKPF